MSADLSKIEELKHELAKKLEAEKWEFRKQELQYIEAGQHLRGLNQLMWQVPGLAIAITGGLWFGATSLAEDSSKMVIFLFTGLVDCLTVITLSRLRQIIQLQIDIQNQFSEYVRSLYSQPDKKGQLPNKTVIRCWGIALFGAALISFIAAFYAPTFSKKEKNDPVCSNCCNIEVTTKSSTNEIQAAIKDNSSEDHTKQNQQTKTQSNDTPSNIKEASPPLKKRVIRKKVICKS